MKNENEINYENIILCRTICSLISIGCCIFIIVIYCILWFRVKCKKREKTTEKDGRKIDSLSLSSSSQNGNQHIGLGSHFMVFLILSNFFSCISYIVFYIVYKEKGEDYFSGSGKYLCSSLGLIHNFLDGLSITWTTMITRLFLLSTEINEMTKQRESQEFILGILYSFISSILFTFPIFFGGGSGFAKTHCSFDYSGMSKKDEPQKSLLFILIGLFNAFAIINCAYNIYCLILVTKYYSNKLKNIDNIKKREYHVMKVFVFLFKVFPVVLVLSRGLKGANRLLELIEHTSNTIKYIFEYVNGSFFCLNGCINSLLCVYFFRGVFNCCSRKEEEVFIDKNDSNFEEDSSEGISNSLTQD